MAVIGIDVGINGGCAVINPAHSPPLSVCDLPTIGEGPRRQIDVRQLCCWIKDRTADANHVVAFVELAMAMPSTVGASGERRGMGAASAFNFGRAVGALHAMLSLMGVSLEIVAPVKWKHYFGLRGTPKENSRLLALQRFPKNSEDFKRKLDHQRAEAALIALYGYEQEARLFDEREPDATA